MRKFYFLLIFLFLLLFSSCDQSTSTDKEDIVFESIDTKFQIKENDLPVISTAEELKDVKAKKIIWKKDGAQMVQIPYETYDRIGNPVLFFYMDATEVTVGQFKKFLTQTDHPFGGHSDSLGPAFRHVWGEVYEFAPTEKYPMNGVTWNDAAAYAKWAGKRLPTLREWEWAARGGLKNKKYPWGDDKILARDYANYDSTGGKDKWDKTAPVGSFKPNKYGLYDMAGNLSEWCQDWWEDHGYDGRDRYSRGGNWNNNTYGLRVAGRWKRSDKDGRWATVGFRCVSESPPHRF